MPTSDPTGSSSGFLSGLFSRVQRQPQSAPIPPEPVQPQRPKLDPLSAAAIMEDGYQPKSTGKTGDWQRVDDEMLKKLNLDPGKFRSSPSGMHATLYRKPGTESESEGFVLDYRGTARLGDWSANFRQALGMKSEQHEQSMLLGKEVSAALGPSLVGVTGHSKGGGQALLVSQAIGVDCVTANPAWPSLGTLKAYGFNPETFHNGKGGPSVTNLVVEGEPLQGLQSTGVVSLVPPRQGVELQGPKFEFKPQQHSGLRGHEPGDDPDLDMARPMFAAVDGSKHLLKLHGIGTVRESLQNSEVAKLADVAHKGGLSKVDHIIAEKDGGQGHFLVEGKLGDPSAKYAKVMGALPSGLLGQQLIQHINQHGMLNRPQIQQGGEHAPTLPHTRQI
ncbi:XVIPCD domain-containing protein [Lysobacter antibioticus]|uniref:XVIPCD domain-containing protein n=1 Tax=Lysobacter antibioticus TaxID=84531 RepID=UPI000AB1567A|nr:XVIPCD domain-containing protein [Lysobacter antibioticus]